MGWWVLEEFDSCFKAQPGLVSVSIYRLKREYSGIASIFFSRLELPLMRAAILSHVGLVASWGDL
jgi:hypothetical protein